MFCFSLFLQFATKTWTTLLPTLVCLYGIFRVSGRSGFRTRVRSPDTTLDSKPSSNCYPFDFWLIFCNILHIFSWNTILFLDFCHTILVVAFPVRTKMWRNVSNKCTVGKIKFGKQKFFSFQIFWAIFLKILFLSIFYKMKHSCSRLFFGFILKNRKAWVFSLFSVIIYYKKISLRE